jgi:hypothetical protein
VPEGLQPGEDEARYAGACEAWMSQIRAVAGQSPTGPDFEARVEISLGTLAKDAQNQVVVVSSTGIYSTVVDGSVLGTTDAMAYQRWVSSIDRKQLPTKFEVGEGQQHAEDEKLETLLKHLHDRQAEESLQTTKIHDMTHDTTRDPRMFLIHMQVRRQQSAEFENEHSRYIQEHREAERLAEELSENQKQQERVRDLGSKFYR